MRSSFVGVGLVVLALAVAAPIKALAGKPPPPPPPPVADPAIAFVRNGSDLVVMNADGTNQVVVLSARGFLVKAPDWSPDGTQLVFAGNSQGDGVYVVNRDGTGLRKVIATTTGASWVYPAWSPAAVPGVGAGQPRIAYSDRTEPTANNDLYVVNVDGTDRVQLTDTPDNGEYEKTWSASGSKLACRAGVDSGPDDLWGLFDFASGTYAIEEQQGALQGQSSVTWPAASKTQESKLAWSALAYGANYYELWIVDLAAPTSPFLLTSTSDRSEKTASWSPNDGQIVFVSDTGGKRPSDTIEVVNANGTGRHVIAQSSSSLRYCTWRRNP